MPDVLTTLTQVDATIEDLVSVEIQEVLTASMVIPPTILDISAMVGPGMDTVKIPKYGHFTVTDKASGTAVSAQTNAFTTDDLVLNKHQVVQWLLEDIAELQSKIMVSQAYVRQSGKDMAAKMDLDILALTQFFR